MVRRGIMCVLVSILLATSVATPAAGADDEMSLAETLRILLSVTNERIQDLQEEIAEARLAGHIPILFPVFDDDEVVQRLRRQIVWEERVRDGLLEEIARLEGAEPRRAAEQATDVSRRVFRGEGRFGLQYQEPGLKCQVRDRVLDITLILEADGDASLEFPKWPRHEGLPTKLEGDVLVRKARCFMEDEGVIFIGTWTSNGDGTVDAVIDFLTYEEPWPVPITVDAKNPAAAGAEHRVPVVGDCPGKKWSAKKIGREALKIGKTSPKADDFRCYLFDFVLIEEVG